MSGPDPWDPDWEPKNKPPAGASHRTEVPGVRKVPPRPSSGGLLGNLGGALGILGLIPTLLALACVAGLVLRRGGSPAEGLITAGLLTVLPIAGLWALFGRRQFGLLLGLWGWPLLLLWGTPQLFPGERGSALAEGLGWLAAPLGESVARKAGTLGQALGTVLGDDPDWSPPSTAQPLPGSSPGRDSVPSEDGVIVLPFESDVDAVRVRVTFDGPTYSEELPLLFDTGATLTTLDRGALRSLGIEVGSDAPTARFQTANGEVESPLVLMDRLWLDEENKVEGITVAVCDSCTRTGNAGLLGLNVTGLFLTTVDPELKVVTLSNGSGRGDRRLDVAHWLDIKATATSWPSGRVEVELELHNRSTRLVEEAVMEIACPGSGFSVSVSSIPPSATKTTRVELPRGSSCPSYQVFLRGARW